MSGFSQGFTSGLERSRSNFLKIRNVYSVTSRSRFGVEDANLACQNASLMAEALGVSQIYMGFVLTAVRQDRRKRLNRMLGLQGRRIGAVLAFGMPEFLYPNYIDRDPAPRN